MSMLFETMSEKIVKFIEKTLNEKKAKNSQFSMRAFAKSLNIEHSILSKILSRKRNLTFEMANRILRALEIQTSIKNSLLLTISNQENFVETMPEEKRVTLSEKQLQTMFRWYFFGVLSALEVKSIEPTLSGLADFLNLDEPTVQSAIDALLKVGAIDEKEGVFTLKGHNYTTTNNIPNQALVDAHVNHIDKALIYLKENRKRSDFTGVTFAISGKKYDEAVRRIKEFRRSLASWLENDNDEKTDVYRLNIQFFPFNKPKN